MLSNAHSLRQAKGKRGVSKPPLFYPTVSTPAFNAKDDNFTTMKMLTSGEWLVTYVSLFSGSLRVGPPGVVLADFCLSSPPTVSSLPPVKIHSTPDLPYSSTVVDRVAERQIFCNTHISYMRVTIRETPRILVHCTCSETARWGNSPELQELVQYMLFTL